MSIAPNHYYVPTTIDDWTRSDSYHNSFLIPEDPVLDAAVKNARDNGLPEIAVSKAQGKLLNLLVKSVKAKKVLEVGTLGGFSAIWMARALPEGGKLITLELSPLNAEVAAQNIKNAGLENKVEIKVGPAAETIKTLGPYPEPFDFVFIDANKSQSVTYFIEAKRLLKSGGVIIVDNVVWFGKVADPGVVSDESVDGIRELLHHIKEDREVEATTIGMANDKGYDGFMYVVKL